jgi:hypothetical protein
MAFSVRPCLRKSRICRIRFPLRRRFLSQAHMAGGFNLFSAGGFSLFPHTAIPEDVFGLGLFSHTAGVNLLPRKTVGVDLFLQ